MGKKERKRVSFSVVVCRFLFSLSLSLLKKSSLPSFFLTHRDGVRGDAREVVVDERLGDLAEAARVPGLADGDGRACGGSFFEFFERE